MKKRSCIFLFLGALFIFTGCSGLKYLSMHPKDVVKEAEFYGVFKNDELGGEVIIIVKLLNEPMLNESDLFLWVVNHGKRPINFNYLVDKISYYIGDVEYFPRDHNTILDYPNSLNPGRWLQYGNRKSLRFPDKERDQITSVAWKIWDLKEKFIVKRVRG